MKKRFYNSSNVLLFKIFFSILISIYKPIQAQEIGFPYIRNYEATEFNAHPLNWCITQNNKGLIYIGNRQGILEYDGVSWQLIQLPKKSAVRSLAIDEQGIIYVGGSVEFGMLIPDSIGKMKYFSLLQKLNENERKISSILQVLILQKKVYFRSNYKLYCWNGENISVISSKNKLLHLLEINGSLYARVQSEGLVRIEKNLFIPVLSETDCNINFATSCQLSKKQILLPSRSESKIFLLNTDLFEKDPKTSISIFPLQFKINYPEEFYTSTAIDDERFVVTGRESAYIIDKNGNLLFHLDKNSGFRKPFIYNVFCDKNKSIWFALENGLARVESEIGVSFHHPASFFDLHVLSICRYKGVLYLATLTGIYYIENNKAIALENEGKSWDFLVFSNTNTKDSILLVARDNGVSMIKDKKIIKLIPTNSAARIMHQSKIDPNRIYVGLYDGVISIYYKNGQFVNEGKIKGIKDNIRSIYESKEGRLWMGTFYNGIILAELSKNIVEPIDVRYYTEKEGVLSDRNCGIFSYKNTAVFASDKGIMQFDPIANKFFPDSTFGAEFCNGSRDVAIFKETANGVVFISGENNKKSEPVILQPINNNEFLKHSYPFKIIPEMIIDAVFIEDNVKYWLGGTEGLICIDRSKPYHYDKDFSTCIRKVVINHDSVIFNGNHVSHKNGNTYLHNTQVSVPKLKYAYNSIHFYFAALHYVNEAENKYQYKLEGYENNWSEWTSQANKEYTNLNAGEYTFKVRAKNVYGVIGQEDAYTFVITTPWYSTIWAYFAYIILLLAFIYFGNRIYSYRLRASNARLEMAVKVRTDEILQQADEIRAQAEELEKLSLVVSKTDNAVVIMDAKGNFEWVNEGFTRLYKLTFEEFLTKRGKNILECSSSDEVKQKVLECLNEKKTVSYQFSYLNNEDKWVWAQTTITPIFNGNNEVIKFIAIDSDITKLKEAEAEIQAQNKEIQEHTAKIEEINQNLEMLIKEEVAKNRQKDLILNIQSRHAVMGEMIGNIAHQWRQPLNAVGVIIQNLEEAMEYGELDEKYLKEKVQKAMSLIGFMSQTIDDFRNFFKPDKEKVKFCINQAVKRSVSFLEANLKNNNIKIVFEVEKDLYTVGYPNEYGQVVINILNNAKDVLLERKIENAFIKIRLFEENNASCLIISDNAGGIPDNVIDRIFDPYFTTKSDEKGTGLGLYICKTIVEKNMQGTITVKNNSEGAEFLICLPNRDILT